MASIRRFGLGFLADRDLGSRLPENSARCRSSGARCIRRCWRCVIATPIALGIAIFISELSPAALRQPLVFLTELLAAIPSIVYGLWGIFVLVPAVRALESVDAGGRCARRRCSAVRRSVSACCRPALILAGHGGAVHLVGRPERC